MRLRNDTHWNGRDISRLVRAVSKRELDTKHHLRMVEVRVKYERQSGRGILGRCSIGKPLCPRPFITLYLPRREITDRCVDLGDVRSKTHKLVRLTKPSSVDPVLLANTIAHEFGHAYGKTHREMNGTRRYGYADGWRDEYAWASAYPVRGKTERPKPTGDQRLDAKSSVALAAVKRWQTRVKRAKTMLAKAIKRARYYETKMAAISVKSDA